LLEDAPFRRGETLVEAGDQGFLLQDISVTGVSVPEDDSPAQVDLTATGWFWPVGEPGAAGIEIGEVHVRQFSMPVTLQVPRLVAGAGAAGLSLGFGRTGTLQVRAGGAATLPFGQILVSILSPDGSPGTGTLGGGAGGGPEARLIDVADGPVGFTYTPPAAPGTDVLMVRAVQADGAAGMEFARFELATEPGP